MNLAIVLLTTTIGLLSGLFAILPIFVTNIVDERQENLHMMMRGQGVTRFIYWNGHYMYRVLLGTVIALFLVIVSLIAELVSLNVSNLAKNFILLIFFNNRNFFHRN